MVLKVGMAADSFGKTVEKSKQASHMFKSQEYKMLIFKM